MPKCMRSYARKYLVLLTTRYSIELIFGTQSFVTHATYYNKTRGAQRTIQHTTHRYNNAHGCATQNNISQYQFNTLKHNATRQKPTQYNTHNVQYYDTMQHNPVTLQRSTIGYDAIQVYRYELNHVMHCNFFQGTVVQKKRDLHKLAESNRAFANFRWW